MKEEKKNKPSDRIEMLPGSGFSLRGKDADDPIKIFGNAEVDLQQALQVVQILIAPKKDGSGVVTAVSLDANVMKLAKEDESVMTLIMDLAPILSRAINAELQIQ